MTAKAVADEQYGKMARRFWEIQRRVAEGTLLPEDVTHGLQLIIEGHLGGGQLPLVLDLSGIRKSLIAEVQNGNFAVRRVNDLGIRLLAELAACEDAFQASCTHADQPDCDCKLRQPNPECIMSRRDWSRLVRIVSTESDRDELLYNGIGSDTVGWQVAFFCSMNRAKDVDWSVLRIGSDNRPWWDNMPFIADGQPQTSSAILT